MNYRKIKYRVYKELVREICFQIEDSGWRPEYIVGITRGGLLPAVMISHYFKIPCHTLGVSLRDSGSVNESNLWMSQDASEGKKILVVDDINDSGETLNWIKNDWETSALPKNIDTWNSIWNKSVKFAAVFDNTSSKAKVAIDYFGEQIDKEETNDWIQFPYEEWWK